MRPNAKIDDRRCSDVITTTREIRAATRPLAAEASFLLVSDYADHKKQGFETQPEAPSNRPSRVE